MLNGTFSLDPNPNQHIFHSTLKVNILVRTMNNMLQMKLTTTQDNKCLYKSNDIINFFVIFSFINYCCVRIPKQNHRFQVSNTIMSYLNIINFARLPGRLTSLNIYLAASLILLLHHIIHNSTFYQNAILTFYVVHRCTSSVSLVQLSSPTGK